MQAETLEAHNRLRAAHGAPPLEWSDECATLAGPSQICSGDCSRVPFFFLLPPPPSPCWLLPLLCLHLFSSRFFRFSS